LTAAFVSAGCPLVTDDCLALDGVSRKIFAWTGYAGLRLWPDSAASTFGARPKGSPVLRDGLKLRLRAPGNPQERTPLRRIYLLSRGPAVSVAVPPADEAFIGLVRNTQILDPTDAFLLKESFDRIGRLLEKVPVRRLSYPRDYSRVRAVREAVLRDLERS
jgi:hypothetical protein